MRAKRNVICEFYVCSCYCHQLISNYRIEDINDHTKMPLLYCQSVRQDMILKKHARVCEKCPSIDKKIFQYELFYPEGIE